MPFVTALVIVERVTLKMPTICQKMFHFHSAIVEEALFDNSPDALKDVIETQENSEFISRQRQRREICKKLKRSFFILQIYMAKHITKCIMIAIFFLPINA